MCEPSKHIEQMYGQAGPPRDTFLRDGSGMFRVMFRVMRAG
jgi:hypothetical protein